LKASRIACTIYDAIDPNPTVAMVDAAFAVVSGAVKPAAIIAYGGGT